MPPSFSSLSSSMFRCPVCQPPFTQPDHQSYVPYVPSSFSSIKKPTQGDDYFIHKVSSGGSSSTKNGDPKPTSTRRTSNIHTSTLYSTPPTSPSDINSKVVDDASISGHKYQSWNSTSHKSNVGTAATRGGGAAFSSHNVPRPSNPSADLHSEKMSFDHSSLVEIISSLQQENRRLSELLLQVMKEKEELVSRHEEESFRMVDDFEREKEELNKCYKEPSIKTKTTKTTKEGTTDSGHSLSLVCVDGPHLGESIEVKGTLIIGSATSDSSKGTSNVYSLWKDHKASRIHSKLVLNKSGSKSKQVLMIKVYDLMSDHGTKVNNKIIPKGSSRQAFIKDKIQIGQSVFRISKTV